MPIKHNLYIMFLFIESILVSYTNSVAQDENLNLKVANDMRRTKREPADLSNKNGLSRNINYAHYDQPKPNTTTILNQFLWSKDGTTRKQYEMINLLWKKTKVFLNDVDIYSSNKLETNGSQRKRNRFSHSQIILTTPTLTYASSKPSNIEFYYMEENFSNEKHKKYAETTWRPINETKNKQDTPLLWIRLKGPYGDPPSVRLSQFHMNASSVFDESGIDFGLKPSKSRKLHNQDFSGLNDQTKLTNKNVDSELHPVPPIIKSQLETESTTIYDKIKFFEIYDQYTQKPNRTNLTGLKHINKNNIKNRNERILLEHVDQSSHDHDKAKLSKKHIKDVLQISSKVDNANAGKGDVKSKAFVMNFPSVEQIKGRNGTTHDINRNQSKSESANDIVILSYMSGNVSWSEYPFMAVYINEPSQVYCDAAGISPHWLVASASCLSRVIRNHLSGIQSPYVAYCGERWWRPERLAYVKYSLVHPSFHRRDMARRHLYNIGVIQVVTSMESACAGWKPALMISYQFAADPGGSEASALGWGLDRFVTKYDARDLPKHPLMIYKGLVYHGSCPGNVAYSEALRLDSGGGLKNVHCLSLPPYSGETKDPVHGGVMLFAGKLIALYLQEERRPWGHQSAQYTGLWHLIPWVTEKAKEQYEIDPFTFEL